MMNQNFSRIVVVVIAGVLAFSSFPAEALVPIKNINLIDSKLGQPPAKKQPKNTGEFCTKFTDTADTITASIGKQESKSANFFSAYKDKSKQGRDTRDADLKASREKADQERSDWYQKLEDKADTDVKKDAVVLFKQKVDAAVDTRQKSVDAAVEAFRTETDKATTLRIGSIQLAHTTFKNSVNAAISAVKTNCENGATSVLIRFIFTTSLEKARETLKDDKKNMDKVKTEIKSLATTRQEAVKKAIALFQTTQKTAVADLKKAFGE